MAFIRSQTSLDQWKHVPGKLNPADIVSRGSSVEAFASNLLWKNGPPFLQEPPSQWPNTPDLKGIDLDSNEIKKESVTKCLATHTDATESLLGSTSSFQKLERRIAWLLRLRDCLKTNNCKKGKLEVQELEKAEVAIWKFVQGKAYDTQIKLLGTGKQLPKGDSLIKLNPMLGEDGLLRVGGRLKSSSASYSTKHPIILPKGSHAVKLMTEKMHQEVGHLGRKTTMAKIREKYWIVGRSSVLRPIISKCTICGGVQGKPGEQIMADLPPERLLSDLPPFTNCGVDILGPLEVRRNRRNKIMEKRYGAIFTCLASRAVHLEVVSSLSLDSFICALRRFIARRGNVTTIL